MTSYIFYTAIALFIAGIINNMIYLTRIHALLIYIKSRQAEAPEQWDMLPLQLSDMSPLRTKRLLAFLRKPDDLGDETLATLKRRALLHLRIGYAIFGAIVLSVALGFAIDIQ